MIINIDIYICIDSITSILSVLKKNLTSYYDITHLSITNLNILYI